MQDVPGPVLERAVAEGIISATQRDRLLALVAGGAARTPDEEPSALQQRINAVQVAYAVGALAVIFAFGWFLADRWERLGAPGVLAVSVLYAAIFAVAARTFHRLGYLGASDWMTALVVVMAPVAGWAVLELLGAWPSDWVLRREAAVMAWPQLALALFPALAALVALRLTSARRVAFELALALACTLPSLSTIFFGSYPILLPWMLYPGGIALMGAGYGIHRRSRTSSDRRLPEAAESFLGVGLACVSLGIIATWEHLGVFRHVLPLLSIAMLASAVYLRRRLLLVFGMMGIIGYLAYLSFDVFRRYVGFPVVLATFGVVVILLTVYVQRRYPALVARADAERGAERRLLPGDWAPVAILFVLSLIVLGVQVPRERERTERERIASLRLMHSEAVRRQKPPVPPDRRVR